MNSKFTPEKRADRSSLLLALLITALLVGGFVFFSRGQETKADASLPAANEQSSTSKTNESKTMSTNTNTTDTAETDLRKKLTPEQYRITQECGTEPAFHNAYWDNHKPGVYVDVVTGKPLFTSLDKFDSGSGWPSFTKPIAKENVTEKKDSSYGMQRVEVRGADSNSHLGHLFDDGPRDKGGMRYCINSAALRFVPVEKLKEEGYAEFLPLFEKKK